MTDQVLHMQGRFTHTLANRDSSTVMHWGDTGPALHSDAAGEGQGQFSLVLKPGRETINSRQPYSHCFWRKQELQTSTNIGCARLLNWTWHPSRAMLVFHSLPGPEMPSGLWMKFFLPQVYRRGVKWFFCPLESARPREEHVLTETKETKENNYYTTLKRDSGNNDY